MRILRPPVATRKDEEYNGFIRYSTKHPEFLHILQEEIENRGEILVHTRYWARAGSTDDELFRDVETFKKRAAMNPPNANMTLILGHTFLLEGLVDEDFIQKALCFPYEKQYLLLMVEEQDPSKNRAYYAPDLPVQNMEELQGYLEESKGQNVKIGLYTPWYSNKEMEVLGYVPFKNGTIDWRGPY